MNTTPTAVERKNYIMSLSIIGALFFIFGFVTWLNGSLMPFLQTACELTPFQASLVTLAFYIAYFVMALPSSFLLKKTGYKNGVFIGLLMPMSCHPHSRENCPRVVRSIPGSALYRASTSYGASGNRSPTGIHRSTARRR